MVILIFLLMCAILLMLCLLAFQQSYWQRRGIPHSKPDLLRGNMAEWRRTKQFGEIMKETYDKFKSSGAPFAGLYFYNRLGVVLLDLQLIKRVLITDFDVFHGRGLYHNERDDPLTGNMFFMDGDEKWRWLRNKISPTFTSGKIKNMFDAVAEIGKELSAVFAERVGESKSDANIMEISELMSRFTSDVIGCCAFGLKCNSLRDPHAEFVRMGKLFLQETRHNKLVDAFIRSNPKWGRKLHMRVLPQAVHDFYLRVIRETVAFREREQIKCNDFVDMLIDIKTRSQGAFTIEQMAANSFAFFVAGFESSSTTLSYALYELARHPALQDKLRTDVLRVLAQHKHVFSYECIKDMPYLEMVVAETLRLHPPLAQLSRQTRKRYETSDPKYYIEAGTLVIVPVLGIHLDPAFYAEPEKFDPERFSAPEVKKRTPFTYLPFGDGPRNCIGMRFSKMQTSIGLASLLKDFRFSVCCKTQIPSLANVKSLSLGPANGIYLKVQRIPSHTS